MTALTSWSQDEKFWAFLVLSSWFCNIGHGLMITVVGPSQPYIARNVDVEIDTINLVWTFGFGGYLFGSLITGYLLKRFVPSGRGKLTFLWATICVNGVIMCVVPFLRNFGLLVFVRAVQNIALGGFITADCAMLVFTMGPVRSRPFTNALHAFVGVGFFISSFVVKPFLPEDDKAVEDRDVVCNNVDNQTSTTANEVEPLWGLQPIAWPFIISGVFCIVVSFGYLILGEFLFFRLRLFSLHFILKTERKPLA